MAQMVLLIICATFYDQTKETIKDKVQGLKANVTRLKVLKYIIFWRYYYGFLIICLTEHFS